MQAIETEYKGYRFRSRLEARWAVFFEKAEISYQYEPEGFQLKDGKNYLPDFLLTNEDIWVEVKGRPTPEIVKKDDKWVFAEHVKKCDQLARGTGKKVVSLCGEIPFPYMEVEGRPDINEVPPSHRVWHSENSRWTIYRGGHPKWERHGNAVDMDPLWPMCDEYNIFAQPEPLIAARKARFEHGESGAR